MDGEPTKELVRMWRVWKTTKRMLYDRGYEILEDELETGLPEFQSKYQDPSGNPDRTKMYFSAKPSLTLIEKYQDVNNPQDISTLPIGTIWVEFHGEEQMGIKQVRSFAHQIETNKFFTGIFITAAPVSAACLKLAAAVAPRIIEIFHESDLVVNITMHELVPKHVVLSKIEKQKLLERYRLKESQLPRIQVSDPVARYLGLRRGQVVKIVRRSITAGRYASYRWCI